MQSYQDIIDKATRIITDPYVILLTMLFASHMYGLSFTSLLTYAFALIGVTAVICLLLIAIIGTMDNVLCSKLRTENNILNDQISQLKCQIEQLATNQGAQLNTVEKELAQKELAQKIIEHVEKEFADREDSTEGENV